MKLPNNVNGSKLHITQKYEVNTKEGGTEPLKVVVFFEIFDTQLFRKNLKKGKDIKEELIEENGDIIMNHCLEYFQDITDLRGAIENDEEREKLLSTLPAKYAEFEAAHGMRFVSCEFKFKKAKK